MALIKCSECGREISMTAETCPWCGHKKIHIELQYFTSLDDVATDEQIEKSKLSIDPSSVRLSIDDILTYTENRIDFSIEFHLHPGEVHIYDKGKASYQREMVERDIKRVEDIDALLQYFVGERSDCPKLYSTVEVDLYVYRKSDDKQIGTIRIVFLSGTKFYFEAHNWLSSDGYFTDQEMVAIIKANKDVFKLNVVDCRKPQNNSTDTNGLFSKITNFFTKLFKRN